MFDPWLWTLGGTLIGGGSLKGMQVYIRYALRDKTPELTEDEKVRLAIEAPLTEPEKTLPEHCHLFLDRLFEKRLVEAGVMKAEDMSVCDDGPNCPECGETARRIKDIADRKRKIERAKQEAEAEERRAQKQAEIERLSRERREREHRERMAKYEAEKWQAIKDDSGRITGHIRSTGNGDYMYESMGTGKRKMIRKADARRYCKKCWSPLRRTNAAALGTCLRGCEQEIPKDRMRTIEGYNVEVPEKVPYDAFGKIDRGYSPSTLPGFFAVQWRWINPSNGETMTTRSLHPKDGKITATSTMKNLKTVEYY